MYFNKDVNQNLDYWFKPAVVIAISVSGWVTLSCVNPGPKRKQNAEPWSNICFT